MFMVLITSYNYIVDDLADEIPSVEWLSLAFPWLSHWEHATKTIKQTHLFPVLESHSTQSVLLYSFFKLETSY